MSHSQFPKPTAAALPPQLPAIQRKTKELGFGMPSELPTGELLRSLVASKPRGTFLELGTGLGLSLSWMLSGMCSESQVISVENDPEMAGFVSELFASDSRVSIAAIDGEGWIEDYEGPAFDLIFADTWPGKYNHLDETLALLRPGGIYFIDDMLEQPNWPEGHAEKATTLMSTLSSRKDMIVTSLIWSTGVVIAVKRSTPR